MSLLADQLQAVGLGPEIRQRRLPVSRASFGLTDRAAFDEAVQLSLAWITRTANAELPVEAHDGSPFEFQSGNGLATASALRVDDEQGSIWAARIAYLGDRKAGRAWLTDLFVEQRRGAFARFGAQLNCECLSSDPGFDHSRPKVIQDVLGRLAGEADDVALTNSVELVPSEEINELAALLYNSRRRLPVVVVSTDDSGGAQVDLQRLANRLSGTAHLRSVAVEAGFELSRTIGTRMSAYNGAIRLYMPGLEQETEDPFQHPLWLAPASGSNPRAINQIASRVLPLGFRDADGDSRFWRIGLLRQTASRAAADAATGTREEQLTAEIEALRSERDGAREAAESAEALMYEESSNANQLQADFAKLQEENFSLRERLRQNDYIISKPDAWLSAGELSSLYERQPTLETSLHVIETTFSDRVTVLRSAYESARDSYSFQHRSKTFDLLWSLCTDYWAVLEGGKGDVLARKCFGAAYAAKEASAISTAGRKRRTSEYNGTQMEMEKHLKIGVADNKSETLRVHFEWIAEEKRLIIGHCGAHLDF